MDAELRKKIDQIKNATANQETFVQTTDSLEAVRNQLDVTDAVVDDIHDTDLPAVKTDTAAILLDTANLDTGLVCSGSVSLQFPDVDQQASVIEIDISDINDDYIATGEITALGIIYIYRFRTGTDVAWQTIVNGVAMASSGAGSVGYSYTWPNASWAKGDMFRIHIQGVQVTLGSKVFELPRKTFHGIVGLGTAIQDVVSIETKVDTVDTVVDGIQTDLSNATDGLGALKAIMDTSGVTANAKTTAGSRLAGELQVAATTEDLQQIVGNYTLFTGTTQDVMLESLVIRLPNVDVSNDVNLTSISIQTDDVTPSVIISSADGAKANLTAEAQLGYTGAILVKIGTIVQLAIAGGAADFATVCDVVATCRAVVSGGYLA